MSITPTSSVAGRYGNISFFLQDQIVGRSLREYGEWSQIELDLLSDYIHPGDTVVDGGAFIGTHSLAFSKMVGGNGEVLSFEPNEKAYTLLNSNIISNDIQNIKTFSEGLSSSQDVNKKISLKGGSSSNPGSFSLTEVPNQEVASNIMEISFRTLDSFQLKSCDFIKLDIEGYELQALIGAEETIKNFHPKIFVECNNLHNGWKNIEFLSGLGYRAFVAVTPAFNPGNFFGNPNNIFDVAKEVGLLFLSNGAELGKFESSYLAPIETIDDLTVALINKPQYKNEVLRNTSTDMVFGNDNWLNQTEWESRAEEFQKILGEEQKRYSNLKDTINEFKNTRQYKFMRLMAKLNFTKKGTYKLFFNKNFLDLLLHQMFKPNLRVEIQRYTEIYKILFDPIWYEQKYEDIQIMIVDPFYHFLTAGWQEGRKPNPLFDTTWYLENNPDVKKINPLIHYWKNGWMEGRKPHLLFDPGWYLSEYPDVASAGMEPLSHYISVGWMEGRRPTFWFDGEDYLHDHPELFGAEINPFVHFIENCPDIYSFYNQEVRGQLTSSSAVQAIDKEALFGLNIPRRTPATLLSKKKLTNFIKERLSQEEVTLALSHDDYLNVTGGVQNCVSDQQDAFLNSEIGYLHIYPTHNYQILKEGTNDFFVGINLNGEKVGTARGDIVLESLEEVSRSHKFNKLILHHTMGFDINWIENLTKVLGLSVNVYFWLHDYFSICPSYNLLRNKMEFCDAPHPDSNACSICVYGTQRKKQARLFENFFQAVKPAIISPSSFTLDYWDEKTELEYSRSFVQPHGKLQFGSSLVSEEIELTPVKVAFLGYPSRHKGWEEYIRLVSKFSADPRYSFYHFGNRDAEIDLPIKFFEVNVSPDDREKMIEALIQQDIDIAFLWAIWPETYSFTLFESISAGCFVITNRISGNIQAVVGEGGYGKIYQHEEEIYRDLQSGDMVDTLQKYFQNGKKRIPFEIRNQFEG